MNIRDIAIIIDGLAPVLKQYVAQEIAAAGVTKSMPTDIDRIDAVLRLYETRIATLETRLKAIAAGEDQVKALLRRELVP